MWLWLVIIVVVLLTAVIIVMLLIRSKKRKEDTTEEVIADIEHVPAGGIRSDMPAAQIVAQQMQSQTMAGSVQYGYVKREPMMRGPVQTLPGSQGPEVQLPVADYEQYQTTTFPTMGTEEDMGMTATMPTEPTPVPPARPPPTVPIEQFPPDVPVKQAQLPQAATQEPNVVVPTGLPAENTGQQPILPPARNKEQIPPPPQ